MTTFEITADGLHVEKGNVRGSCRMVSGRYVDPFNIRVEDISIKDIAHHLSMICRYNGGCLTNWSVAEHCVALAIAVKRAGGTLMQQLTALLHDASEAYIGDIVRPLKVLPQFEFHTTLDRHILDIVAIYVCDELLLNQKTGRVTKPDFDDELVNRLDKEICPWEMAFFRDQERPAQSPKRARKAFLKMYRDLVREINNESRAA